MGAKQQLVALSLWAVCSASTLAAQGSRVALVPHGGFALGYNLAEDVDYSFDLQPAAYFGVSVDLTLTKVFGLTLGALRSVGQPSVGELRLSLRDSVTGAAALAQTMVSGALVIRPGGRRPTGAPTPLYIEAGGGLNFWTFGNFVIAREQGLVAFLGEDFNANKPFGYGAVGFTLPVGPRAQLNIYARANYITEYSSRGLDDFNNAEPPARTVKGKAGPSFMAGIGMRVGR